MYSRPCGAVAERIRCLHGKAGLEVQLEEPEAGEVINRESMYRFLFLGEDIFLLGGRVKIGVSGEYGRYSMKELKRFADSVGHLFSLRDYSSTMNEEVQGLFGHCSGEESAREMD